MAPAPGKKPDRGWMHGFEFWSIAALFLVPCVMLLTWSMFSRACAAFWHPMPGFHRYCSNAQTWEWALHHGGWWKLALELGVFGMLAWAGSNDDKAAAPPGSEPAQTDDGPPPA